MAPFISQSLVERYSNKCIISDHINLGTPMRSAYFIADFGFNPACSKPLAIYELGDAFTSTDPGMIPGSSESPYQVLLQDIQQLYPAGLFVQLRPGGLKIVDFNSGKKFDTYDKKDIYNDPLSHVADSADTMIELIGQLIAFANFRSEASQPLILHLGQESIYSNINVGDIYQNKTKILNLFSLNLNKSFSDKALFSKFAKGSPIYPATLFDEQSYRIQSLSDFSLFTPETIKHFMEENPGSHYVIKPAKGTRAESVYVLAADEVLATFKQIKEDEFDHQSSWKYQMYGALLQVCHPSKKIYYKGDEFYAKGRAIIRADFAPSAAAPIVQVLSAFWELAAKPATLGINNDTMIINTNTVTSIESSDLASIKQLISTHMPAIIKKMIEKDARTYSPTLPEKLPEKLNSALIGFFSAQGVFPNSSARARRWYQLYNHYIDDTQNQLNLKTFTTKLIGLHPDTEKNLRANDRPLHEFMSGSVHSLFSNHKQYFDPEPNLGYRMNKEAKKFLMQVLFLATINWLIENLCYQQPSIQKTLITGLLATMIFRFSEYALDKVGVVSTHIFDQEVDMQELRPSSR